MALDFGKLGGPNPADTVTQPRQLFTALPTKGRKFGYPRDVQSEVWTQWYERRSERDLVIKMNTGSGKTVVGLVILKSCLNEGAGPAVYVVPDKFLASQVVAEAAELGLTVTENPRDPAYTSGRAILVTNIYKLLNGKSVFGTADTGIPQVVGRDAKWVQASKAALVGVRYDREAKINPIAVAQRAAFNSAQARSDRVAIAVLEGSVNTLTDKRSRGWLKEQLAKAIDAVDAPRAQEVLLSASIDNRLITKPVAGIGYAKLAPPAYEQGTLVRAVIDGEGMSANGFLLKVEGLSEQLQFQAETAATFEGALKEAMNLLGFTAQRPEQETGRGPDLLVALGSLVFLVVECKNGAVTDTVARRDANQLSGSAHWFRDSYDATCSAVPVLVHPSTTFDRGATPPPDCMVLDVGGLESFRAALKAMARGAVSKGWPPSAAELGILLDHHGLVASKFIRTFAKEPRRAS